MAKYYIDYKTGAGNECADNMDDAKRIADAGAAYTQQDIVIYDEDENEIARRRWCGVAYNADECGAENPICFGSFGFYDDWEEY